MVEIDGQYGSGGGQVLRTGIGLSAVTGTPCRVINVRAGRPNPGLREQHLQAVNAVAQICGARVEGAEIGSPTLTFIPGKVATQQAEQVEVQISTAGSVGLVLQAVFIAAAQNPVRVSITGGATFGKWAPPLAHIERVFGPLVGRMGLHVAIKCRREGFYPKGGAQVAAQVSRRNDPMPLRLVERGDLVRVEGVSVASSSLRNSRVAERQAESAATILQDALGVHPVIRVGYSDTVCPGSGIQLWTVTANSVLGSSDLGRRGKRAELVGEKAAGRLLRQYETGVVDSYTADQLMPYLAMWGGAVLASRITDHCRANAYVIEKFVSGKFVFSGTMISFETEPRQGCPKPTDKG
jgi:RNA 3'-terminal phosphate cyclase (GTP)